MDKEFMALCDCPEIQNIRPMIPHGWSGSGVNVPEFDTKGNCWLNIDNRRTLFLPSVKWLIQEIKNNLKEDKSLDFHIDNKGTCSCMIIDEKMLSVSQSIIFSCGGNDSPEDALIHTLKWQLKRGK